MPFHLTLTPVEEKQAEIVSNIGRTLQQRFTALGLTPETFADQMESEPDKAMHMLSGSRDFRIGEMISVADVLGMDVEIKLTVRR